MNPSATIKENTNKILDRLRDSYQERMRAQVAILLQAKKALLAGNLDQELKQQAQHEAHKLAGSMATFGYPQGSELGRKIEHLLIDNLILPPAAVSEFCQLVTALEQELTKSPVRATAVAVPSVPNYRVLAVDDDVILMERLLAEAESWGIRMQVACDLTTARSQIASFFPDAVLLELSFSDPPADGLILLRELKQRSPHLSVIVFSSRDSFADRLAVSRLGARQFLHKSATNEQIFQAIIRVLPLAPTSR